MFHSLFKVVILILYFYLMCIRTQNVFEVTKSEKNYFNRKSAFLHNASLKIINILDLKQNYIKLNKIQALLTMFRQQNHIAQNLFSNFDRIKNMTVWNVTGNSLNVRNILENIIREEMHLSRNYDIQNSSVNKFDREFSVFVNMFLNKAFKISMKNVNKTRNRVKRPILNTSWKRTRDIKVWKPSSVEHLDLFNNTRRIYKGKKAKIKDFPFLVSIIVQNEFASAGSIISKDLVITAATGLNILYKSNKFQELLNSVVVRVGSDYAVKEGHIVSVVDVIFHPGYDPHSLQNNLAILRLVKRLRFSDKRKIQRIIYDKKGVFKKNSSVIVLGWGAKDADKEVNLKQKVSVARLYLYDMDKCATMYSRFYVKDSNFCAGFSDKGGGACNKRDTGGPGIVGGELAGVISFGPSVCGQDASPTVFTKIAPNVEWIASVINRERSLNIETAKTELETLFPSTYTIPAKLQQIPLKNTLEADSQLSMQTNAYYVAPPLASTSPKLLSKAQSSRRPLLRVPKDFKLKRRVKLHPFSTVTPENLSNISLPFATTYSHPTLFSESTSPATEIYPDQSLILKEILKEIILSNTSVLDYILYGDILEDNVEAKYLLSTTEGVDVMHHQLVNKSIFLIEKPEEIIHPARSEITTSKSIVENSQESGNEGNIESEIELLNSLYPQPEEPDTNKHIIDDNNFVEKKTVFNNNFDHLDTTNTERTKKKVTARLRNTILYENIRNEVPGDLPSKVSGETKDNSYDYYDDESYVKNSKHDDKQTETSTTKVYKTYKNVAFSLDDIDKKKQDKDRIRGDKYTHNKYNSKNIKEYHNKNNLKENPRLKPYEMDRIGADQNSGANVGGKKHKYNFQENQQDEMDLMERGLIGDDNNKNQEYIKNNINKNSRYTLNEKVQIRDDKYDDESVYDEDKDRREYSIERKESKQYDRIRKDSFGGDDDDDDDNYSKKYQNKNNFQETLDNNQNKGGRMGRFTHSAPNYDDDDEDNIPPRPIENDFNVVGKATTLSNDEFDYKYRDMRGHTKTYRNENSRDRYRFSADDKPDYNPRPMTDEDEREARYYERRSKKNRNK